jgi:hypothetical protein
LPEADATDEVPFDSRAAIQRSYDTFDSIESVPPEDLSRMLGYEE